MIRTSIIALITAMLVLLCVAQALAQNPFLTPPSRERPADRSAEESLTQPLEQGQPVLEERPGQPSSELPVRPLARPPSAGPRFTPPLFDEMVALQRDLRQRMTNYARQIQERPLGSATWQLMLLSFLYGVVHALGPGHGKSIVCTYFVSRRGTWRQALLFGNLITATHILSAVVIIVWLSWVLGRANIATFHSVEGRLESISYALIVLIGFFLLGKTLFDWWRASRGKSGEEDEECPRSSPRDIVTLSLATGLMPCPGAALILLFTLSLNVFWAGLMAMIPLALGMGLTASALGLITVGSTNAVLDVSRRSKRLFAILHRTLACLGAVLIIILGASLLLSAGYV
jgi:nickel/cobalt transporter (NicO) family protein